MKYKVLITAAILGLSACTAIKNERVTGNSRADALLSIASAPTKSPKVIVTETSYVDPEPVFETVQKHHWLKQIKDFSIGQRPNAGPIPLYEIIRQFKDAGVNIATSLPLEQYPYSGFKLAATDAFTALEIITSSIGLDFVVHDGHNGTSPYVQILPMEQAFYELDVTNKKLEFSITDNAFSGSQTTLGQQGGQQGDSQQSQQGNTEEQTSTTIASDFYKSLNIELNAMMLRMVPIPKDESQTSLPNQPGATNTLFREVMIGRVTINPSTGNITIQAPKHVRAEVIEYLSRLDRELNTTIQIEGKIVVVTDSAEKSTGLDINALAKFGGEYGLIINNDVYSNIAISRSDNFSAEAEGALGNLIGITKSDGLLDVFNAYVESNANITTVQEPKITTTSGSLGIFSKSRPFYLNNVSGSASQGESGTTSTTSNNIQTLEFGSSLRVLPTYNIDRNTIRAQIDLTHVVQNGVQTLEQIVQGETGNDRTVTRIPIPEKISIQGEVVIHNESLIVMGGESLDVVDQNGQGIPGLRNSFVGGIFGNTNESHLTNRYYFVLWAKATTYEEAMVRAKSRDGV